MPQNHTELFGYPKVPLKKMMELIVDWINADGKIINKPLTSRKEQVNFN
jgi:hypothetical protein